MATLGDWDVATFRAIHEGWKSPFLDFLMVALTISGLGWVQAILLALAGLASRWWKTILLIAAGAVVSGIVRLLIVNAIGRLRPSNLSFSEAMENVFGRTSFPSGHASGSFAIAMGLMLFLPRAKRWIGWLAIGWASAVALSRIYVGVHFPTDVIGGASLGIGCALLVFLLAAHFGWNGEQGMPKADNNFAGP